MGSGRRGISLRLRHLAAQAPPQVPARHAAVRPPRLGQLADRLLGRPVGQAEDAAELDLNREVAGRKDVAAAFGEWLDQEMERLGDPANYANDPALAWKRIRMPTRKAEVLGRLKALAAWRELEARSKNLPRGRIMKDETVADIASNPPS